MCVTKKRHAEFCYINVSIVFYDNYSQFKPVEKEISEELATALFKLKQYVENS